jgi:lysophospholipid acyltransferase (LPLAT)-like uncharacterized protein
LVKPHPPRWYDWILGTLLYAFIRCVAATLRYRWEDRSEFLKDNPTQPAVVCVWHNRLALCLIAYRHFRRTNPAAKLAAMVSASKDGGFLVAVLECFGVAPVRGSSSRRGSQALLELTGWARKGYDLAITPDGPRGPRYRVQPGVTALAQITGLPIIPCSYNLDWKIQVKSWDRFQIPLPFSRCHVILGRPIHIPHEASDEEREALRLRLEQTLQELSRD